MAAASAPRAAIFQQGRAAHNDTPTRCVLPFDCVFDSNRERSHQLRPSTPTIATHSQTQRTVVNLPNLQLSKREHTRTVRKAIWNARQLSIDNRTCGAQFGASRTAAARPEPHIVPQSLFQYGNANGSDDNANPPEPFATPCGTLGNPQSTMRTHIFGTCNLCRQTQRKPTR